MVKLRLATWNVRTVDDGERRDKIFKELQEHNIDIACLQETKLLAHEFTHNDYNYTIFCHESKEGKCQHGGVGFASKNELVDYFGDYFIGDPKRLKRTKIMLDDETIHIINVYAPTNSKKTKTEDKDSFYYCLDEAFSKIPKSETVFIIGDFNAKVGSDNVAWPTCIGPYGVGKINDNGQRLLEFCSLYDLCVLNTFTELQKSERCTHQHSGAKTWSQLDLCITRLRDRHKVMSTRTVSNLLNFNYFDHKMVILEIDTHFTIKNSEQKLDNIHIQTLFRYLLRSILHIVIKPRTSWPVDDMYLVQRKAELFSEEVFENKSMFIGLLKDLIGKIEKCFENKVAINSAGVECITTIIIDISQLFLKEKVEITENDRALFFEEVERYLNESRELQPSETKDILRDTLSKKNNTDIANIIHDHVNKDDIELNDRKTVENLTIQWCKEFILPEELLYILFYKQCMNIVKLPTTFESTSLCRPVLCLLTQCLVNRLQLIITADKPKECGIFECCEERDFLLALNLLQEKCLERFVPLYIAFIDLSQILTSGKTPISIKCLAEEPQWVLYLPLVFSETNLSDEQSQREQKHLMDFLLSHILATSLVKPKATLKLNYTYERELFHPSRLNAKLNTFNLRAIRYQCYAAIFATKESDIQQCIDNLELTCNSFGLSYIHNKPSILSQNVEEKKRELNYLLVQKKSAYHNMPIF